MPTTESLVPIRPGVPGKRPFWNSHSTQFKYAPAFDFKPVAGASRYRFTATSGADSRALSFEAGEPWAPLTPIWKDLPVGEVILKVDGLNAAGETVPGSCGEPRKFWRSAVFHGPYHNPARPYAESARMGLRYLFAHPAVQIWKEGMPDPDDPSTLLACYGRYGYPSKMIGGVIRCAARCAAVGQGNQDGLDALRVMNHAFDYLTRISEPADAPLAFLPPTYRGKAEDAYNHPGQIMMSEPVGVANAYLDAYEATGDRRFAEAARHIADTYAKTLLPLGTWPLMIHAKNCKAGSGLLIPVRLLLFLDRIDSVLGRAAYDHVRQSALAWLRENPLRTFDWQGQFEDTEIAPPYRNHMNDGPASTAMYLIAHRREDAAYLEQAEELLRFAEDQFVVWQLPFPATERSTDWITPCVLEQYIGYYPVDASAATMITAYQRAYLATGSPLYLAKATSLANAMTIAQDPATGSFPTYWAKNAGGWWLNCAAASVDAMFEFAKTGAERCERTKYRMLFGRDLGYNSCRQVEKARGG